MLGILNVVLRSLRSLLALVSSSAVLATPPCPAPPVRVCRAPKRLACNRFITAFQLGVSLPHRPAADAGPPETMKVHTPRAFAFDRYAPPPLAPPNPPGSPSTTSRETSTSAPPTAAGSRATRT